ncbi:MAG: outer membrane beta-barrel protein, partial [Rariglobus sp.]
YRELDYQLAGRTDDYIEAVVGARYIINEFLSANLSYLFRDNSSNVAGAEFDNNVVTVSLSARY